MRSRAKSLNAVGNQQHAAETARGEKRSEPDHKPPEQPVESDESSDLDESDLPVSDDDRWDVFILDDDDCDPLPDYGDFWLPD